MYARLMRMRIQAARADEVTRIYHEHVLPAARRTAGFRGATLLTDDVSGRGVSVTFWETELDMLAGEASSALQGELRKLAPLLAEPAEREVYRVSLAATPEIPILAV